MFFERSLKALSVTTAITLVLIFGIFASQQQAQGPPQDQPPDPMPSVLQNYKTVTAERLKSPDSGDWLMVRRTYDGWGYSPLDQITTKNVDKLQPVWSFSTGVVSGHEAPPIVNNGVMFIATPSNQLIAIDVRTGKLLWRFRRPAPEGSSIPHQTSRGVALYGDKVFFAVGEAVLIAIDAKTGKEVWATKVAENKEGYYTTMAPLVADGKVLVGASGGEFGIRGFIAAFDPDSGKELWRAYTIPAPGEPGSETWPKGGDQWKNGGGSVWVTPNYDVETNLVFVGTGNGGPWMGDKRPGDNLYTSSTIAVDAATGKIKGHFQYDPNESWDWDEVSPPILVDFKRGGRMYKGLIDVGRDGYLWFLERSSDKIRFVEGKPFVRQNVYKSLDPETGRPVVDPERKPGTGKKAEFCPSLWGGKNWPPIAFSPKTRMIYIPANENICGEMMGVDVTYTAGRGYTGQTGRTFLLPDADHIGEVQAWDVDTGKKVWTHLYPNSMNWGPMLATAGGLVFSGGTNDRYFHAFDAKSGKLLWQFPTNSGITSQPTSFAIDGKQYVAVQSGWGVDPAGMQGVLNRGRPGQFPEVPQGGAVWVFSVK